MSVTSWEESANHCSIVRSLAISEPTLTQTEIGDRLGFSRALVAYYLGPKTKAHLRVHEKWSMQLALACRALKEKRNVEAAREFYELAQMLSCKS